MSMKFAEDCNVFRCTECGHFQITEMDEQPPVVCEKCMDTSIIMKNLFNEKEVDYIIGNLLFDNLDENCIGKKIIAKLEVIKEILYGTN